MPATRDPTRTIILRRAFARAIRRRFNNLKSQIRNLIITLDAFGLGDENPIFNQSPREFAFLTDPQKIQAFRRWLAEQVEAGILTTDALGQPWTAEFIEDAYRRGRGRAFTDVNRRNLEPISDFFAGSREEFLRSAFSNPETVSKVQLLATRSFEELRGVTETMAQRLNRELANGIIRGDNPRTVARNMTEAIDGLTRQRAELIARTEIVHAHAEGQLDGLEDLGIEEVTPAVEWTTAGDDRVCPRCAANDGEVFTIKQARGLIPLHPNCRCAWLPAL